MALTKAHARMIEGSYANVKDFGAVGDGTTDDTVAIQLALDDGRGPIYFPPGVYIITSTLTMPDRCKIFGAGGFWSNNSARNTVIKWGLTATDNPTMIQAAKYEINTTTVGYVSNILIQDISIEGNGYAGCGLFIRNSVNESSFKNINIRGCTRFGLLANGLYYDYFDTIQATENGGIGMMIGVNWNGKFWDNAVNGVKFNNLRAWKNGDPSRTSYPDPNLSTGYDATTRRWGGSGIYIGTGFQASSTIDSVLSEQSFGSNIAIETSASAGRRGIINLYSETSGGLASIYAFGTSDIPKFYIENIYDSAGNSDSGIVSIYNDSTGIELTNANAVDNIGSVDVYAPRATKGQNFTSPIQVGDKIGVIYGSAYALPGGAVTDKPETFLLPGPNKKETTTGAKTFDGYQFNINNTPTIAFGGLSMLVTLYINGWASGPYAFSNTQTYMVTFAHRQAAVAATSDYDIQIAALGTVANIDVGTGLVSSISMTAVKNSSSQAVLRASYTINQTPVSSYGGVTVSWSAVVMDSGTRDAVVAL
tara:strand:+ start:419 stop:2023 length:1605 start_codon:yes stop_codon:yes gene_type:complete